MTRPRARAERKAILHWVERVAAFFADAYGMPPITGRILGWLMICDPPEQSAADIAAAIGASRASLSTNIRLLTAAGLVQRRSRPGGRTSYYHVDDDAWEQVVRRRFASIAAFRKIAEQGLALVGSESPRASRIRAVDDIFAWTAELLARSAGPPSRQRRPS